MRTDSSTLPFTHIVLLTAGVGMSASSHLPRLVWWISAGTVLIFAWRLYLAWSEKRLPSKWLLLALALGGIFGVFATFRTIFGRDAGVTLLVLLLALKMLEMRALRDVFVLIFLSYFLALTNFFYSQTIPTAVLMTITVMLLTTSLVSMQAPGRELRDNARTAGTLLLQAGPVMLLLFCLVPRVQGPLWGLPQDAFSGVTGLSDSMSPGTLSQLSQSDAIAFRVKFSGVPPPRGQLYWRGPVFWAFDGITWRAGVQSLRGTYQFEALGAPVDYEVTLEPHNRFWLFGLEMPSRTPPNARVTGDFQILSNVQIRTRLRYEMRSFLSYRAAGSGEADDLRAALALPRNGNARARGLGEEWRRNLQGDEAILRQAIDFFRNGRFEYTLQPPLLNQNPVDEFLFDTKQGFCEHFASSFTYLMRSAGVPARVVTGYQGGELNPIDQYMVVRQADAHAWSEVWLKDRGWVRVDPTATAIPLRLDGGFTAAMPQAALPLLMRPNMSWLRAMRNNWDAATNQWNQWVLGFNPDRQRDLLARFGVKQPGWGTLAHLLFWSVAAVIGVTALWMLWRIPRRDPVQAAWLVFCKRLARRGLARRPAEGPLDYAARISSSLPEQAAGVHAIAALYADLRYGREHAAESVLRLRRLVSTFRP